MTRSFVGKERRLLFEQQFVVFKEVADTKNITLAAKRLHMSQPSISLQIQNMENLYGARFFNRTNKGVTLTKAGEVFYDHVNNILNILTVAQQQISVLTEDQRALIYIGATLTIGEYILPNILAYLYKIRPDVDFKVKIANTETISQEVIEKRIHIGLIEGPAPRNKEIVVEKFWQDELVVVVPSFHPWAARHSITLAELAKERLIMREEGSGTRKVTELALKEMGLDLSQINVTMELGSTQAIKKVVAAGIGITIISSLTVSRECENGLFKVLKVQDSPVYRPLNMLTLAHTTQTKDERFLISMLHDQDLIEDIINGNCEDDKELYPCGDCLEA
ncbi:HTH-type transcriptional regulator CysL [bioreactor metagenome]|uniref:HTH-type transcriptional regulator CysL n=1 Tax=bioreactor metagenome TaxID=1076179 RepID=A0A644V9F1_9ZZZZ|nr:LysR family transcriptional regulator [Desulfitobacterium hafniense]MEA5025838.1 LysR family transcriptional regulator [Desulfitobacterium hafniense]